MSRGAFRAAFAAFAAFAALGAVSGICSSWAAGPRRKAMNGNALSIVFSRASLMVLASLVVLLCSAAPLRAQVDAGSITGTVTDASGGSVNGVSVTLINQGTNATLTTTTGADGVYK